MKHRQYDFRTAYIDLLLNMFTAITAIVLFMTALIAVDNQKAKEEGVRKDADYIIIAEWDPTLDCDVDIWGRDPAGNIVSFQNKEAGLMFIDRDDLGKRNDSMTLLNGENITVSENKEFLTIREKTAGEYVFTVHLYACGGQTMQWVKPGTPVSIPVKITFMQVNPMLIELQRNTVELLALWDEKMALRFTLNTDGTITYSKEITKLARDVKGSP